MRERSAFPDDPVTRTVLFPVLFAAWLKAICATERLNAQAIVDLAEQAQAHGAGGVYGCGEGLQNGALIFY
jgi:hypothetical protein